MKTLLIAALVSLTFLGGCKKQSTQIPDEEYYVKYKLNGNVVMATNNNYAYLRPNETDPSKTDFALASTTDDFKHFFSLYIQRPGTYGLGTYTIGSGVFSDYFQDIGLASEKIFSSQDAPGSPACSLTINLTEITNKNIRGNFTANYHYDIASNQTITITDGEFFVRRMK